MSLSDRMTAKPFERLVNCEKCGRTYRQVVEDQATGFRVKSEDDCPYCGFVNRISMSSEYYNYKLEDNH